MVQNQQRQAKGDMECFAHKIKNIFNRADTQYSNVLIHWNRVSPNANVEKRLFTSMPIRVVLNSVSETSFAVHPITNFHAVSNLVRPSAEDASTST